MPDATYDAGTDRVYITTGNGLFNANTGGNNWGDSVLALKPDGTGAGGGLPVDSYTPTNYAALKRRRRPRLGLAGDPAAASRQHVRISACRPARTRSCACSISTT